MNYFVPLGIFMGQGRRTQRLQNHCSFFHCCHRKLSEKQEKLQANNLELNGSNARLKSQVSSYSGYFFA